MKNFMLLTLACILACSVGATAGEKRKIPAGKGTPLAPCTSCHDDLAELLEKSHPETTAESMGECLTCHKREEGRKRGQRPFSAKVHRAHINEATSVECTDCHTWSPDKSLGLPGRKAPLGTVSDQEMASLRKIFLSWTSSSYLDGLHSRKDVTCFSCHGEKIAEAGDLVESDRCLYCHGPWDRLLQKTAPTDFPDRNPHQSHLGEIDCTVCHKGHTASSVYCLGCHKNFTMKIPGG